MSKIKRIDYIESLSNIFYPSFKTIKDEKGNEFVLFKDCYPFDKISGISDKTAFEAVENHIHILNYIKKDEYNKSLEIAEKLGQSLLHNLETNFPLRKFVVYVSVKLHDSMIIRFHQQWQDEFKYLDPDEFNSDREKVFMYCN